MKEWKPNKEFNVKIISIEIEYSEELPEDLKKEFDERIKIGTQKICNTLTEGINEGNLIFHTKKR